MEDEQHILKRGTICCVFESGTVSALRVCNAFFPGRQLSTWVDNQLAAWDAGMKTPPESVYNSFQVQGGFGRLVPYDRHLEVGMSRQLCETGRIADVVDSLDLLVQQGCHLPNNLFYRVLKRCIATKDLPMGKRIHALTTKSGYEGDAFLATHLIGLYASHGRLEEAMRVFTTVSAPDAYNWATIIFAYARHGEAAQAIRLYKQMRQSTDVKPTDHIYLAVLKACASAGDLAAGREVHAHILASPGKPDIFVQTGMIDMYAKCGSLQDARSVFDNLPQRDVVSWNAMIAGYAQQGMGQEALSLYYLMQQKDPPPNSVTFLCLLQACASVGVGALQQGKQLHAQIEECGLQDDVVLGGSLVTMYMKCGILEDARSVFDKLSDRNVYTWNAMLVGYVQQGMGLEALCLYHSMQQECLTPPDSVTYVCVLQACASIGVGALPQGKRFHAQIEERGWQADVVLGTCLIHMYAKCGSLKEARSAFDQLQYRNAVTWTVMIAGYAEQGMSQEALSLYCSFQQQAITPSSVTYVCLLHACANVGMGAQNQGKELHAQIEEQGMQDDVDVGGSLVNMYAKCGSLEDARKVFDGLPERNVLTWNAMLAGYAQYRMGQDALSVYSHMQEEGIVAPNAVTFTCLLQACASVGVRALLQGKQIYAQIEQRGLQDDEVLGGSLVNMFTKCGSLEDARSVFDKLGHRNVVTWTAMIAGYAQQGMGQEALCLYSSMQQEGITPADSVTFVCLLQACAIVAALPLGQQLHTHIQEQGLQANLVVGSALVNMYAKCGSMFDSRAVFDSLPERTIEAWNALIGGYTRQGDSEVVFDLVQRMRLEGIRPDGVTFLCMLVLCSHVGLVEKGQKYFEAMITGHGITPTAEHYTCMTDLLGRAGHLDEALQMVKDMPLPPDVATWLTLLAACRKWKNVEIGQQAFEGAVSVDGKVASGYLLMSNIYASAGMWEDAERMEARRIACGAWQKPGESWWTDMGGGVHSFVVDDKKTALLQW